MLKGGRRRKQTANRMFASKSFDIGFAQLLHKKSYKWAIFLKSFQKYFPLSVNYTPDFPLLGFPSTATRIYISLHHHKQSRLPWLFTSQVLKGRCTVSNFLPHRGHCSPCGGVAWHTTSPHRGLWSPAEFTWLDETFLFNFLTFLWLQEISIQSDTKGGRREWPTAQKFLRIPLR